MAEQHKTIYAAMAAVFAEMPGIGRDSNNPYFRSKYTSLDQIINVTRPILARHGVFFMQLPEPVEGDYIAVRTIFGHTSGEKIDAGVLVLPAKPISKKGEADDKPPTAQSYGSATTYAKRYALAAALGICDIEDDDGNAAAQPSNNGPARREVPTTHAGKQAFAAAVAKATGHTDRTDIAAACKAACLALDIDADKADSDDWKRAIEAVRSGAVEFKPKEATE